MLDWFRRIRRVSQKLSLPSRESGSGRSQVQLNPSKLTPSTNIYLAHLAQVQLEIADLLQDDSQNAPTDAIRQKQQELAESYRKRAAEVEELIVRSGSSLMEVQAEIRDRLDLLVAHTEGKGWEEDLMRVHIVFGILEDSLRQVARGLPAAKRIRVEAMLLSDQLEEFCSSQLSARMAEESEIAGRLAMFGRMVVADALLEVRDSVSFEKVLPEGLPEDKTERAREQFRAIEPFVSELISEHTMRMDRLGLTA